MTRWSCCASQPCSFSAQGQGTAFAQHQQQQMAAQLTMQQPRLMISPQGLILQNGLIMPIMQQQQQQPGGAGAGGAGGAPAMGSMQHGTLVPSGFQLQVCVVHRTASSTQSINGIT